MAQRVTFQARISPWLGTSYTHSVVASYGLVTITLIRQLLRRGKREIKVETEKNFMLRIWTSQFTIFESCMTLIEVCSLYIGLLHILSIQVCSVSSRKFLKRGKNCEQGELK